MFYLFLKACPHGHYGQDCSTKCKDTCVGCNNVDGLCESGCIAGWMGERCQSGIIMFIVKEIYEILC